MDVQQRKKLNTFAVKVVGIALLFSVLINIAFLKNSFLQEENVVIFTGRIFGSVILGSVFGLLPFFIGRNTDRVLAEKAFWRCLALGLAGGVILALPAALIHAVILLRKEKLPIVSE